MNTTEEIDLFDHVDTLPTEVQCIINKYAFEEMDETYENMELFKAELKEYGYTFDYYLDAIPYNLRKI